MLRIQHMIKQFLSDLDEELRVNVKSIRCCDIYEIYFKLFDQLKMYRCNSSGFTGFSEFLIFRLILQSFSCEFERYEISKDCNSFISRDRHIELTQGISLSRFRINLKPNISPDVAIWIDKRLSTVFQIKTYLPKGINTFLSEMDNFKILRHKFPELKAVFLMYVKPSSKGTIAKKINDHIQENDWLTVISLQGNSSKFYEVVNKFIRQ